jgi:hypothetical protein
LASSALCASLYIVMVSCIFHIDLDAFLVSVEQLVNPQRYRESR